jgi:hypothetical protein
VGDICEVMSTELSISLKRDFAEALYLKGDITQKEIAARVKVNEKTIGRWVEKYKWESLRKSLLTTKSELLRNLYNILDRINDKLKEEESIGDSRIADMYVKYTASIKNLETDTNLGQIVEVLRMFVNYLQTIDPEFALSVLNHSDKFVKDQLKRWS